MDINTATEQEMRDTEVPGIYSMEELVEYINALVAKEHDYGTAVYAMSMAAVATFNYVAYKEGVTGFQASCADLDIIRRIRHIKGPFMLIKGYDMLYPQYDIESQVNEVVREWRPWAKEEATKLLNTENKEYVAEQVWQHWLWNRDYDV
jgi:hypothetical protein